MKNSKLTGCLDVFRFTYIQSMKSKAMKITIAVFCVIALLAFPVTSLISGDEAEKEDTSSIQQAYIYQENIELSNVIKEYLNADDYYKHVEVSDVDKAAFDNIKENALKDENCMDVVIEVVFNDDKESDEYGLHFMVYYSDLSGVTSDEADSLSSFLGYNGKGMIYTLAGIDEATAKVLTHSVSYQTFDLDADGNIISDGISTAQYTINYALLMVVLLCVSFSGAKVAEQIVTEKSTKVIEYILTSVKPMAIVTGKVLASVAVVLSWLGSVVVCLIASGFINGALLAGNGGSFALPEILTSFFDPKVVSGANLFTVVISLLVFVLGFVFYGFLGGISGAMVSKVEELSEGTKLFSFAMLIGAYLALGLIMSSSMGDSGWGMFNYVVYFFPLSSMFIVPSYMLFGIVSPLMGVLIVIVNLICTGLLVVFVSRIYEQMIYYSGKLKIKDLFQLSKNTRRNK